MRIAVAAAVAAMMAAPALAAPADAGQGRVSIRTVDLDLATPVGQRGLERRLEGALLRLCGQPVLFSQEETDAIAGCRAEALQAAAPQIEAARARQAVTVASSR